MKNIFHISKLLSFLFIMSCDPATFGHSVIQNNSNQNLEIKYKIGGKDTIILLPTDSIINIGKFQHIGNAKYFDCCPCENDSISIYCLDSNYKMSKAINLESNWKIDNDTKHMMSPKEITCQFEINQTDIK